MRAVGLPDTNGRQAAAALKFFLARHQRGEDDIIRATGDKAKDGLSLETDMDARASSSTCPRSGSLMGAVPRPVARGGEGGARRRAQARVPVPHSAEGEVKAAGQGPPRHRRLPPRLP